MKPNIFITGFSGSGKTTVGREVARRLGWRFADTDEEIARAAGMSVDEIFSAKGEPHFRKLEAERIERLCDSEEQVVSTGGGIAADDRNWELMNAHGLVACLEALPHTIHERLSRQDEKSISPPVRPMLEASDHLERIRSLKAERQHGYARAHWTVHTDGLTPDEAAAEVVRGWTLLTRSGAFDETGDLAATVTTSAASYPVWVGWGILDQLAGRVERVFSPDVVYIITDERASRQAHRAHMVLEAGGIASHLFVVPPGETSKSLEMAQHLFGWLAGRRAERSHLILAVGGGVVGDLAGFVAATFLRGMRFAQVPTTLVAMMDAAIGGKTAVNLPQGKNLVGAFHQPGLVLADIETLGSLPDRELTSGWAEAIKHGLILDEALLRSFEGRSEDIRSLHRDVATDVIRRSVAVKARAVSQDETETLGVRILLNYGHTIGHAIEAATGYRRFLHGEAVSIGMMGAAYIAETLEMMSADEVERQARVLERFDLPIVAGSIDLTAVQDAMSRDKKTSGKVIRWVLLEGIGNAVTRSDVPPGVVRRALERLTR